MPCSDVARGPIPPCILVVEDDVLIRMLLAETLRERGAGVIEAANGDEAWAVLAAGRSVDLIISDIRMPGSLNGAQLAKRVRGVNPSVPIILTSADAGPDDLTKLGILLQKPYDFQRLLALVMQIVDLPSAETPP
jgi:CheY-like chemotaxis protein